MNILAVDTAGKTAGVALLQDDRLLYEVYLDGGMTHSETLMPMIDTCLKMCGMTCADIDLYGVNAGPGQLYRPAHRSGSGQGPCFPAGDPVCTGVYAGSTGRSTHRRGHRAVRTGCPPRTGVQRRIRAFHPPAPAGGRCPGCG